MVKFGWAIVWEETLTNPWFSPKLNLFKTSLDKLMIFADNNCVFRTQIVEYHTPRVIPPTKCWLNSWYASVVTCDFSFMWWGFYDSYCVNGYYESLVMLIIDYGPELLSDWGPVIHCHSGGCTSVCEQELSLNIMHVCTMQSTSCYGSQWAGHIWVI